MWRLTVATALAHRARLALTVLAVALGVAFVAGSLILTDTSTRLRTVLALLRRETAIVDRFGALPTPPDPGGAALN